MKLTAHKLQLDWPNELPIEDLRKWLLKEINNLGEPLRWAITAIRRSESENCRQITLHVVLIDEKS